MPIKIVNKKNCTGCTACYNACPQKCIDLIEDEQGFKYPKINMDLCCNCEKCILVCPIKKKNSYSHNNFVRPKVMAVNSLDAETRFKSTSGGTFTELAKYILNLNGVVYGASYNNMNMVEHIAIEHIDEIEKIRKSKYLQSDLKKIFSDIKTFLDKNRIVLFCGAPCQIAGLYSYLGKEYKNLITADFVCRGVNSPKAFKHWINEFEELYKDKVINIWFKYKCAGWKESPYITKISFLNGNEIILDKKIICI